MSGNRDTAKSFLYSTELALIVAIVVVVTATALIDSNHTYFNKPEVSVRDIARNLSLLGIFALGAAVVIIAGGIDLSAGSVIAFSGTVCAGVLLLLTPETGPAPAGAVVLALGAAVLSGLGIGTLHTWLITAVRLPPFIATLATLVGLRSFARALCEFITFQAQGSRNSQIYVNHPALAYLRQNVWVSFVVFAVLALVTWLILSRTVLGRHIYALGGNEQAARLSGIRTENVKWVAYCFSALTASIAAIFYIANESVANPVNQARGHELNAIAAAVVGGCSLQGGVGTVSGTILGVLFLRIVIDAVAKIIKTGSDVYEGLIVGCVVVLAVTLTQMQQFLASGRQVFAGVRGICAIPTLALTAGLIAMVTFGPWVGLGVGVLLLLILSGIKVGELSRNS
ncbi:Ribose transport system permease protein RbsC [Anatilimnocola aggregata]|uniref:Ribose transport system permease protein RbsC n=1 Tax=Anatilimnocola aggregata TaxID=2528021 RepID=A0A517YHK1_9BACT|nr:ABC transporter permease [Anatilimnocola aggregata]QDU29717.1 Ribose transport system permease protein RbsC [Anatilimnocola aggregata]